MRASLPVRRRTALPGPARVELASPPEESAGSTLALNGAAFFTARASGSNRTTITTIAKLGTFHCTTEALGHTTNNLAGVEPTLPGFPPSALPLSYKLIRVYC